MERTEAAARNGTVLFRPVLMGVVAVSVTVLAVTLGVVCSDGECSQATSASQSVVESRSFNVSAPSTSPVEELLPTRSPLVSSEVPTGIPTSSEAVTTAEAATNASASSEPPSSAPTEALTDDQSNEPTGKPTSLPPPPTNSPTTSASTTSAPTSSSTTSAPTDMPPTKPPTDSPTRVPTDSPTNSPTDIPTRVPTDSPTSAPTDSPIPRPTRNPTSSPTQEPHPRPTRNPTGSPTREPHPRPTRNPTSSPTQEPHPRPTRNPTSPPTREPHPPPTPTPTSSPTLEPHPRPTRAPTATPTRPPTIRFDGQSGALVTSDCLFEDDYAYAIDIFWSCGDERFNEPLRLHTFKRHSRSHALVFADQLITYRNQQLWFDEYNNPRCIAVQNNGDLVVRTAANNCNQFEFTNRNQIRDLDSGQCIGLGSATCSSDRSTGGRECGRRDHRYLPLEMGPCGSGLVFAFKTKADDCANGEREIPENACF